MRHNNIPMTTSFLDFHQKHKKKFKTINVFRCKKHGRIDVKHDKLINIAGVKYCPFCVRDMFEQNGICQLRKSKEQIKPNKGRQNNECMPEMQIENWQSDSE